MAHENAIPKQVQQELDDAEAAEKLIEQATPPVAPTPAPAEGKPTEEVAPVMPEQPVEEAKPEETPVEAPAPEPEPTEALDNAPSELDILRQEHAAFQRTAENDKRWFQSQISSRDKQIQAIKAEAAKTAAQAVVSAKDPSNPYGLTEAELAYEPEILSAAEKIAKYYDALKAQKPATPEPETATEPAPESPASSGNAEFWSVVTARVPDWKSINDNPKFNRDWLDGIDPTTGVARRILLKRAQKRGDGDTAADILLVGKRELQKKPNGNLPSKSAQVMPRTQTTGQAAPEKKTYTMAEYDSIMQRVAIIQATKPSEAAKLMAEMKAAEDEGRIRP